MGLSELCDRAPPGTVTNGVFYLSGICPQSTRADTHRRVCLQSGCTRSLHGDMAKDVHRVMDSLTKTKEKKKEQIMR